MFAWIPYSKKIHFFDELEFPQLAEDAKLDLENYLSIEELVDAVQSMNSGKAPGPDGLPVEIYKTFSKRLPHLHVAPPSGNVHRII